MPGVRQGCASARATSSPCTTPTWQRIPTRRCLITRCRAADGGQVRCGREASLLAWCMRPAMRDALLCTLTRLTAPLASNSYRCPADVIKHAPSQSALATLQPPGTGNRLSWNRNVLVGAPFWRRALVGPLYHDGRSLTLGVLQLAHASGRAIKRVSTCKCKDRLPRAGSCTRAAGCNATWLVYVQLRSTGTTDDLVPGATDELRTQRWRRCRGIMPRLPPCASFS